MRHLSYPGTDVFMFCYSCVSLSSFENIGNLWLKEVKEIVNPDKLFVFLLVGTKQDLVTQFPEKEVDREKGDAFVHEHRGYAHIQCSARNYTIGYGDNIKQAFSIAVKSYLDTRTKICTLGNEQDNYCCSML